MKLSVVKRIIPIALIAILTSCQFEEVRMGYPKNIEFTSEGGEINVSGDNHLSSFDTDIDGIMKMDSLCNWVYETEWLTIEAVDDPEYNIATSKFIFMTATNSCTL